MKHLIHQAQQQLAALLQREQLPSGEFPVFIAPRGTLLSAGALDSTPFATALVVRLLYGVRLPALDGAILSALRHINEQQLPHGAWRYWDKNHPRHGEIPPDADTTSCCALALKLHGRLRFSPISALLQHRLTNGRFPTWLLRMNPQEDESRYAPFWSSTEASPGDCDIGVNLNLLSYLDNPKLTHEIVPRWLQSLEEPEDRWYVGPFTIPVFALLLQESQKIQLPEVTSYLRSIATTITLAAGNGSLLAQAQAVLIRLSIQPPEFSEFERTFLERCLTVEHLAAERFYCGGASRSVEFGSGSLTAAYALRALEALRKVVY